jgi:hypothetical protein
VRSLLPGWFRSSSEEASETGGLRLVAEQAGTQTNFQLSVVPLPAEDDEVIEEQDARVFSKPQRRGLALTLARPRERRQQSCIGRGCLTVRRPPGSVYVVLRVCRGFAVCTSNKGRPEAVYSWGRNRTLLSAKTTDMSRKTWRNVTSRSGRNAEGRSRTGQQYDPTSIKGA